MRMEGTQSLRGSSRNCEQYFPETLSQGSQLVFTKGGGDVFLDTRATANLAGFHMLVHRNSLLGKLGVPRVETSPDQATFKLGTPVWATCVIGTRMDTRIWRIPQWESLVPWAGPWDNG